MTALKEDQFSKLQLQSLIRVTSAVNSTLDMDKLFELILNETISTISHADGGILFLYDESKKGLISKASLNYLTQQGLAEICIAPGESITGSCFLHKQSILLRSKTEVKAAMNTITPKNKELFDHAVSAHYGGLAYRVISVPLVLSDKKCIGVLTINGFNEEGDFTPDEVTLLEAIASQAAMALEKASLYKDVHKHNKELQQMLDFHEEMTDSLMAAGHHQIIIDKLSEKIACPTSLLTATGEVLSSYDFREDLQDHFLEFQVKNATEPLGTLRVFNREDKTLSPFQKFMIQQSCVILALEIHREERVKEMEYRLKTDLLDDLMDGTFSSELMQKARALGLKTSERLVAVIGEFDSMPSDSSTDIDKYLDSYFLKREMTKWIKQELDLYFPGSLVINKNDRFIFLVSSPTTWSIGELTKQTKDLASRIQHTMNRRHKRSISFGIGRAVSEFTELHEALVDANKVLQYIRSSQQTGQIREISSLGFQRLLVQNNKSEIDEFIQTTLGKLVEYDRRRKGEYLKTLITYIQHSRQIADTAKALHIHVNTLHYRLHRIEELLGADLTDSKQLLNIHLACELYLET